MGKTEEAYSIQELIIKFSLYIKRARWFLLGGLVLGFLLGVFLDSKEKIYSSHAIIGSTQIPSNTLTEFIKNARFKTATTESCDLSTVKDIDAATLDNSTYQTSIEFNTVEATIEIVDEKKATEYWNCLLSQLNKAPFISELHQQNITLLEEEFQAVNQQIEKLSTLQDSYQSVIDDRKWNAPIGIFDNSSQGAMLDLLKHKKKLKSQIFKDSQLHIISDIRIDPKPINGTLRSYVIGLLGGIFLSLIVSFFAEIKALLRE